MATGYSERTSSWRNDGTSTLGTLANTSLDATAALAPTGRGRDLACVQINSAFNPATGEIVFTCVRQQPFAAQRYIASAGVRMSQVRVIGESRAAPAITSTKNVLATQSLKDPMWGTMETTP